MASAPFAGLDREDGDDEVPEPTSPTITSSAVPQTSTTEINEVTKLQPQRPSTLSQRDSDLEQESPLSYSTIWDGTRRQRAASRSKQNKHVSLIRKASRNASANAKSETNPQQTKVLASDTKMPINNKSDTRHIHASDSYSGTESPPTQYEATDATLEYLSRKSPSFISRLNRAAPAKRAQNSEPSVLSTDTDSISTSALSAVTDTPSSILSLRSSKSNLSPVSSRLGSPGRDFVSEGIRSRRAWQRDDTARWCAGCGEAFNLMLRKHHCRCCGRVFCSSCSDNFVRIPREWRSGYEEAWFTRVKKYLTGDDRDRVCSTCYDDVALLQDPDVSRTLKWLRACSCTGHLGLPDLVCQIDKVGMTAGTRGWQQAANLLRSELRPLQYKLPTERFSLKERTLLWGNRHSLRGHTQWLVPLMISVDWEDKSQAHEALQMVESLTHDGMPDNKTTPKIKNKDDIQNKPENTAENNLFPGWEHWQKCKEGRQFVSCVSTMCSHTCQGFHLERKQECQTLSPADALRLLSLQPVSSRKFRTARRKRNIWAYVRDLETWKEKLERTSINKTSAPSNISSNASSTESLPSTIESRAWKSGSRKSQLRYLEKMIVTMRKKAELLTQKEDEKERYQNSINRQQPTFLSIECRKRIVGVLHSLFQSSKKEQTVCESRIDRTATAGKSKRSSVLKSHSLASSGKYGIHTQELLCYIPQLVYCLRFSPPLAQSPLADFLIQLASEGGTVLQNEIYWTLHVASMSDPAAERIKTALNGGIRLSLGTLSSDEYNTQGALWAEQERIFQRKCRSLLDRILSRIGCEEVDSLIAGREFVDRVFAFSGKASRLYNDPSFGVQRTSYVNPGEESPGTRCRLAELLQCEMEKECIFNNRGKTRCPNVLSPGLTVDRVCVTSKVLVLDSATRPMVVPIQCKHYWQDAANSRNGTDITNKDKENFGEYKLLVKSEDVRTDLAMLNCIRMMDIILKKELGEDLGILTYSVTPTSPNTGMIEWVQQAVTVAEIREKWGGYRAYFDHCAGKEAKRLGQPKHEVLEAIKNRFMRSLAGYSVATFLLGVGDRHTKNMMVTEDGTYFHIDFGYVLGQDPKPLQPPVRITAMAEEALGTRDGSLYKAFIALTIKAFNCVRHHVGLFTTLLLPLTMDSHLRPFQINSENVMKKNRKKRTASLSTGAYDMVEFNDGDQVEGSIILSNNARNAAPDVSSCRFTRNFLLEQLRIRFLPGMSDLEAEETLAMKFRREHVGAELETAARLASDTYRHQRDTLKIPDKVRAAAGAVGSTAEAAGRIMTSWLASTGSGLLGTVKYFGVGNGNEASSNVANDSKASRIKSKAQLLEYPEHKSAQSGKEREEWVDLEQSLL